MVPLWAGTSPGMNSPAAGAAGALLCAALFPQYLRFLGIGFACYLPCALVFSLIMVCSLLEKPITEAMK